MPNFWRKRSMVFLVTFIVDSVVNDLCLMAVAFVERSRRIPKTRSANVASIARGARASGGTRGHLAAVVDSRWAC